MNTEEENKVISLVKGFIKKMNEWEKYCLEVEEDESIPFDKESELQKNRLIEIFEKFCTKKERKQGAPNTIAYGEEGSYIYDTNDEKIITVEEEEKNNRVIVLTERTNPMKSKFTYVVIKKNTNWLIDSKKRYSEYESKWKVVSL